MRIPKPSLRSRFRIISTAAVFTALTGAYSTLSASARPPALDTYDVVWDSPSDDSRGSMPIGNGDIGLNVWVEKSTGDLVFYVSKTDSWGDNVYGDYGLPKVGRVRVKLDPSPFAPGTPFRMQLHLQEGRIEITGGDPARAVALQIWVDANHSIVHLEGTSAQPVSARVSIDTYRTKPDYGLGADTLFPPQYNTIAWCYRNRNQNVPSLKGLTFGAAIKGDGFSSTDDHTLQSQPRRAFHLRLYPLTAQTETPEAWRTQVAAQVAADHDPSGTKSYRDHLRWWRDFWDRSWVVVSGNADADSVTRGYFLQRFVTACAGRGAYPIKFNGSIFTTDYGLKDRDRVTRQEIIRPVGPDYRTWGGQYWFQNTRPMYWPMLQSGDFDMMQPLFRMYRNRLTDAEKQVHTFYGHDGAYFAETNPFWSDLPHLTPEERPWFTNRYFTPILELSAMMLDYYDYTGDKDFVRQTLLPIADDGLTFFDQHFPKDANGKIFLDADNAIETYWKVQNPAPDIAGLHYITGRLLALPDDLTTPAQRERWKKIQGELPDLPIGERKGQSRVLLPMQAGDTDRKNGENPELYAIYPFRLYGLGKPDLRLARDTFRVRDARGSTDWLQDPIHAAYLGDATLASRCVTENFADKSRDTQERFPVFWGPFHDYTPDEDNGGNGILGLQLMLLQADSGKLLLLPAWPSNWEATFKLHAPGNTIVEGTVKAGHLTDLTVTPKSRRKDVYLVSPDGSPIPYTGRT